MKKRKRFPLTKSELALMEILWDADRPLGRPEILEAAVSDKGEPLFAVNSFHLLINDLIDKEYIVVVSGLGKERNYARRYAPQSLETSTLPCKSRPQKSSPRKTFRPLSALCLNMPM